MALMFLGACMHLRVPRWCRRMHTRAGWHKPLSACCWQDGSAMDDRGIHHRVLSAVVETPPSRDCFGFIDVYDDRLELLGCDQMASAVMRFSASSGVAVEACATAATEE